MMNKRIISALALATSMSVFAETDPVSGPTVYGRIHLALQHVDEADLKNGGLRGKSELRSNSSRLGVKGSQVIDEHVTLIYQLEFRINPDSLDGGDNNHMKHRNSFVGFKGAFGEVKFGTHDTPLKLIQERIDVFNAIDGDVKEVVSKHGENRSQNMVMYTSPRVNGIVANVAHISVENAEQRNGLSSSLTYQSSAFFAGVAYDDHVKTDVTTLRAVVRTTFDAWQFGVMYEEARQKTDFGNDSRTADGWLLSATYRVMPKTTLKAQYGQSDMVYNDGTSTSLGVDYQYAKNARLYAFATVNSGDVANSKESANYNGVGLEYRF